MINKVAIATAVVLSLVAGIISVIGLTSIFASAAVAIAIIGGALEVAKVVSATWLHHNWSTVSRFTKVYLCAAIAVLMAITSMGIYGFLAKAHLDQTIQMAQSENNKRYALVNAEIPALESRLKDLDNQMNPVTAQITALSGKTTAALGAKQSDETRAEMNRARSELSRLRTLYSNLSKSKDEASAKLASLKVEQVGLNLEAKKIEADVGPIKYLAALFYGEANEAQLERSVRWMILLLIFVFDPLAIILMVNATKPEIKNVVAKLDPPEEIPEPRKLRLVRGAARRNPRPVRRKKKVKRHVSTMALDLTNVDL